MVNEVIIDSEEDFRIYCFGEFGCEKDVFLRFLGRSKDSFG